MNAISVFCLFISSASSILFIIGLFSPKTSLFWLNGERTRLRSSLIYGVVWIAAVIGVTSNLKLETEKKPVVTETKKEIAEKQITTIKMLVVNGDNYYVSVKNFDPKNKKCWKEIKDFAHDRDTLHLYGVIHFMDVEKFTPPDNGDFYGDKYKSKVIAQYITGIHGFFEDPTLKGYYVEPK